MALTPTDAIVRVQDNTGRASTDQQCPSAVIGRRLDTEYRLLRRRVATEFPEFYERTSEVEVGTGVANTVTMTVTLVGKDFSQLTDVGGHGNTFGFGITLTLDDGSTVVNSIGFSLSAPTATSVDAYGVGQVVANGSTASTFTIALPAGIPVGRSVVSVSTTVTTVAAATGLTSAALTLRRTGGTAAELTTAALTVLATTTTSGLDLYGDPDYTGATWIAKPNDYESLRLLEKQTNNGYWMPVVIYPSLNRHEATGISFYEQGTRLVLFPETEAPGTYRITYLTKAVDGYTSYDVPDGLEQIIVEETSAFVRQRHEEDPGYHKAIAKQIWDDQYMSLWNRYGSHGRSGLNITRE
jgi:hypothetical protein